MLLALITALGAPIDGVDRFHKYMQAAKSLSVQVVCHAGGVAVDGKGRLVLSKPSSARLETRWGAYDYAYVKSPAGALEFQRFSRLYQVYPPTAGFDVAPSAFTRMQTDSMPFVLLKGDLRALVPHGTAIRLTSSAAGLETYTANWVGGPKSKLTATIDASGRLHHFQLVIDAIEGRIERTFDFSNYVVNPPIPKSTFALEPPTGLSSFEMPYFRGTVAVGEPARLGTWTSSQGRVNMDSAGAGKLLIVREIDSPPADRLLAFLKSRKLPRPVLVLSLGPNGGDAWAPPAGIADQLRAAGTPLILLLDRDAKIKTAWMGFDPDRGDKLLDEIAKAAAE